MSKKKTKEEFVLDAMKIHGDKYDYSKFIYVNTMTKGVIICPIHGEFLLKPNTHLSLSVGCPKCSKNRKLTKEIFIDKSNKKHNNKYDYSKVEINIRSHDYVAIICPEHGEFSQKVYVHMNGQGCPKCGSINRIKSKTKTTLKFIEESNIVHNGKYNYDKTIYTHGEVQVVITCPIHGDFYQVPNVHRQGHGCSKCMIDTLKEKTGELSHSWKGGLSKTKDYFRDGLNDWKIKSCEAFNYKCALTNDKIDAVHHITPYVDIFIQAHDNLNIEPKQLIQYYSTEEIYLLKNEINKLHDFCGLGIPLCKDIHKDFHDKYGYTNFTKEDFVKFCEIDLGINLKEKESLSWLVDQQN